MLINNKTIDIKSKISKIATNKKKTKNIKDSSKLIDVFVKKIIPVRGIT